MPGGFQHNAQSLRMVDVLEKDGKGLNLTWEVRDGIRHHSGREEPATLEGWCVRRADRIAYINHDIDDAIRGGVLKPFELPHRCLEVLGDTHSKRINTMILDTVRVSAGQPYVRMSPRCTTQATSCALLFTNVYNDSWPRRRKSAAITFSAPCSPITCKILPHARRIRADRLSGRGGARRVRLSGLHDRPLRHRRLTSISPNDFSIR
jgi:hypothetical protein